MAGDSHELAETLRIHGPRVCRARLTRPLSHANETLVARRPPEVVSLGSSSALWAGSVAGYAREREPAHGGHSQGSCTGLEVESIAIFVAGASTPTTTPRTMNTASA